LVKALVVAPAAASLGILSKIYAFNLIFFKGGKLLFKKNRPYHDPFTGCSNASSQLPLIIF
jgi:hypothetical protein